MYLPSVPAYTTRPNLSLLDWDLSHSNSIDLWIQDEDSFAHLCMRLLSKDDSGADLKSQRSLTFLPIREFISQCP